MTLLQCLKCLIVLHKRRKYFFELKLFLFENFKNTRARLWYLDLRFGTGSVLLRNLIAQNVRIIFNNHFLPYHSLLSPESSSSSLRTFSHGSPLSSKIRAVQPILSTLAAVCETSLLSALALHMMNNSLRCYDSHNWNPLVSIQRPTKMFWWWQGGICYYIVIPYYELIMGS